MDNYNEYIDSYLESMESSKENTKKRIRNVLNKIRDISKPEVCYVIKELENKKLSTRRVIKSTYKKFFEYVDDKEMLAFIDDISDEELETVGAEYFFNVLEVQHYIKELKSTDRNNKLARKLRTYIYAYLLFIGVRNSDIKNIDIYEFDEDKDIITHGNDVYDIKAMDVNNIIHNEFVSNKNARGIDYETGEYVTVTGSSSLVKSLKGTAFMRTAISSEGGFSSNTSLSKEDRQRIARSGAFIRFYNLKKRTGLDTNTLFNYLNEDLIRVLNRHAIKSEYEEFEIAYKESGN